MSNATAPRDVPGGERTTPFRGPRLTPSWYHVVPETRSATSADAPATPPRTAPTLAVSLSPRRTPGVWAVLGGVAVATLVAVVFGAQAGSLVLAALLLVAGICRAAIPGPGPVGITIRSRGVDVLAFWSLAAAIAFLALTAPNI